LRIAILSTLKKASPEQLELAKFIWQEFQGHYGQRFLKYANSEDGEKAFKCLVQQIAYYPTDIVYQAYRHFVFEAENEFAPSAREFANAMKRFKKDAERKAKLDNPINITPRHETWPKELRKQSKDEINAVKSYYFKKSFTTSS
jgi:hypothetical protein